MRQQRRFGIICRSYTFNQFCFVKHSIGSHLAKYETTKEVWDHLQRLYTQSNFVKQYQLEIDILSLQ